MSSFRMLIGSSSRSDSDCRDHQQPIHGMFPEATIWLGPGTLKRCGQGYPSDPESGMFSEILDPARRIGKVVELSIDDTWSKCGPFEHAYDFFGDGSLMLCDAPGHIPGNMCAIARTKDGKVCLGGDCGHAMCLVDGTHDIGQWKNDKGDLTSMHESIEDARITLKKIRKLKEDGVVIALAHDPELKWDHIIH